MICLCLIPRISTSLWDFRLLMGNITVPSVTCSRILVEATLEITLSPVTFRTHLFIPVIFVKWTLELEPASLCTGRKSTGMGNLFKYLCRLWNKYILPATTSLIRIWVAGVELTDPRQLLEFVKKEEAEGGKFYCSLCLGFSNATRACVRNHVESKHFKGNFIYSCDLCLETFTTRTILNNHKSRKHK